MKGMFQLVLGLVLSSAILSLWVVNLPKMQMAYASPYVNIDVETAYNMVTNGSYPDLVVLDVRTKSEYDSGHIYGAVWMPHTELKARISELAGHEDHEIIVYCLAGVRSANASGTLDSYNFTEVYNMLGGISAWESAGYPVWIATVHNLNTTFNYDTIQAAIDAPQTLDGHTILVGEGTYYEHVVLNKSLSLIGEDRSTTIIDGNYVGNVIKVTADNAKITGLTVQNSYPEHPYCGVCISELTAGNNISHNFMKDSFYAVGLWCSSNNSVCQNEMTRSNFGVLLNTSSNNIISGNNITHNLRGVFLKYSSSNNTISGNNMRINDFGVVFYQSSNNTLFGNSIMNNNYDGIQLSSSFNNTFSANKITANDHYDIRLLDSSCKNTFFHNNLDNTKQLLTDGSGFNYWDDGFEGNYWSSYDEPDADRDGIGENWLEIDENNTDRYPLMGAFSIFDSSLGHVYTICNSTISDFQCYYDSENQTNVIKFNVNETEGLGFCRTCIPHTILNETYTVLVDGDQPDYVNYALCDNGTHRWIYFTYQHSIREVIIIPEFPSFLVPPLLMTARLVAAIVYRRKQKPSFVES